MIALWIVSVALISLLGALGYMILQGWNLLDALYMAVITLTTTGFREVHPLTPAGQVWTMFLSVVAIGIIFGTVGIVAEPDLIAAIVAFDDLRTAKNFLQTDLFQIVFGGSCRPFFAGMFNGIKGTERF